MNDHLQPLTEMENTSTAVGSVGGSGSVIISDGYEAFTGKLFSALTGSNVMYFQSTVEGETGVNAHTSSQLGY